MARAAKRQPSPRLIPTKEDLIRAGVPESNLFQDENGRWRLRHEWRGRIRFREPSGAKIVPSNRTRGVERGPSFSSSELDKFYVRFWRSARRGNPESARLLLLAFCMFIENKQPIPRLLLGYLRSAFRRHLEDGAPINRALLLRPAHRAKGSHGRYTDPLYLAALYFLYRKRDQLPITKAKDKVATESKTTRRTVDKAVKKNDDLNGFSVQELEAIATAD